MTNALFFSIYHFWQPWNYQSIFLYRISLAYPVWLERNVYIRILGHGALNILELHSSSSRSFVE